MPSPHIADDFRAELNWQRLRELKAVTDRLAGTGATDEQYEAALKPVLAIERVLENDIAKSVQALAAVLMILIRDGYIEEIPGLFRACLQAILPQLEGMIGADAERMLAAEPPGGDEQETEGALGKITRDIEALRHVEACETLLREART